MAVQKVCKLETSNGARATPPSTPAASDRLSVGLAKAIIHDAFAVVVVGGGGVVVAVVVVVFARGDAPSFDTQKFDASLSITFVCKPTHLVHGSGGARVVACATTPRRQSSRDRTPWRTGL
jgi:hypothetical protein